MELFLDIGVLFNISEAVDSKCVGLVHLVSVNQLDGKRGLFSVRKLDEHESDEKE